MGNYKNQNYTNSKPKDPIMQWLADHSIVLVLALIISLFAIIIYSISESTILFMVYGI
jgi:hypothetical protein